LLQSTSDLAMFQAEFVDLVYGEEPVVDDDGPYVETNPKFKFFSVQKNGQKVYE